MMDHEGGFRLGDLIGGGPPPPEGVYVVYLREWEQAQTRDTQKPMLKLRWEISSGSFAGRVVYDQIVVHRKGIFRAAHILDALGRERDTFYESAADCATDLIRMLEDGAKVTIVLKHRRDVSDPEKVYGEIAMYSRYVPSEEDVGESSPF